jgi:hypothetical protein
MPPGAPRNRPEGGNVHLRSVGEALMSRKDDGGSFKPPEDGGEALPEDGIAVLLSPGETLVIDLFRRLGRFEERYDLSALDGLEALISQRVGLILARSLVSDALLFSFALRRERAERMRFNPPGSRRGSPDEHRLLVLLGAVERGDRERALRAVSALGGTGGPSLMTLAAEFLRRLRDTGLWRAAPIPAPPPGLPRLPAQPLRAV